MIYEFLSMWHSFIGIFFCSPQRLMDMHCHYASMIMLSFEVFVNSSVK